MSVLCAKLWYGKRTGLQMKHVGKRKKNIITRKDCSSSEEEKKLYLIDTKDSKGQLLFFVCSFFLIWLEINLQHWKLKKKDSFRHDNVRYWNGSGIQRMCDHFTDSWKTNKFNNKTNENKKNKCFTLNLMNIFPMWERKKN